LFQLQAPHIIQFVLRNFSPYSSSWNLTWNGLSAHSLLYLSFSFIFLPRDATQSAQYCYGKSSVRLSVRLWRIVVSCSQSELTMGHVLWPVTHMTHHSVDPWPCMTHDPLTHDPWPVTRVTHAWPTDSLSSLVTMMTCSFWSQFDIWSADLLWWRHALRHVLVDIRALWRSATCYFSYSLCDSNTRVLNNKLPYNRTALIARYAKLIKLIEARFSSLGYVSHTYFELYTCRGSVPSRNVRAGSIRYDNDGIGRIVTVLTSQTCSSYYAVLLLTLLTKQETKLSLLTVCLTAYCEADYLVISDCC